MEVIKLDFGDKKNVDKAVGRICHTILSNKIAVIPTDTIYGISARINEETVERIFAIKKRPRGRAIPVLVDSFKMFGRIAVFDSSTEAVMRKLLPGPISVILPKAEWVPDSLTANTHKIMARIPDNGFLMEILKRVGEPITATSANISDQEQISDGALLLKEFEKEDQKPDLIVDAGVLSSAVPSTILDFCQEHLKIVRLGAYPKERIETALGIKL
jgi:L-threonylcarbamoyladenylate synthase